MTIKTRLSLILVLCMLLSLGPGCALAEAPDTEAPEAQGAVKAAPTPAEDDLVQTHHTARIGGQSIDYTATAGRMALNVDGNTCDMFFTAYTLDGVENASDRPITFAFNGGPGSSTEWLHMGMLGPRRGDVDEDGNPTQLPVNIVDNEYSLLDVTDLVFIDPVGTGFSRASGDTDPKAFYTYASDIASVGNFIRMYVARNGRWGSAKYVVGESYGTTRAARLTNYLSDTYDMALNGVILVSSINDFNTSMEETRSDLSYTVYLPTYAALGWYHGRLAEPYQSMTIDTLMDEVHAYAATDYQAALFRGSRLTDEEKKAVAQRIAAYTGLDSDFVLKQNLRVYINDFCAQLLSDKKLAIGRIDGRYTGPVTEGDFGNTNADPSSAAMGSAFGMAVNQYISGELDYHSDLIYQTMSVEVNDAWKYELDNRLLVQEKDIYTAISQNKFLKIWVLCGYYDLATPFFAAEWVFDHVFLNPEDAGRVTFSHYPSGHMIYMHSPSLASFREEAMAWYNEQ